MIAIMPSAFQSYAVQEMKHAPAIEVQWSETANLGSTPWFDTAQAKLTEFERLGADWDGQQSGPVPVEVANRARKLFTSVLKGNYGSFPNPHLSPISGGSLGVEWQIQERLLTLTFDRRDTTYIASDEQKDLTIAEGLLQEPVKDLQVRRLMTWLANSR